MIASVVQVVHSWNDGPDEASDHQPGAETCPELQHLTSISPDPQQTVPRHQDDLTNIILEPQFHAEHQMEHFNKILLGPDPRLVHKLDFTQIGGLAVVGHRVKRHYSSHSLEHLEQDLRSDMKIQQAISTLRSLLADSLRDVQDFCLAHAWLAEVHVFAHSWGHEQMEAMRGWTSRQYEERITQLLAWTEKVKRVKPSFVTRNRILSVECSSIQDETVPLLDTIARDILSLLSSESRQRTELLLKELGSVVKVLDTIDTDIPTVSSCARVVDRYKKLIPELQQRVDYVRSLSEVIRMSYRQLTAEEETLENAMLDAWESFHRLLKEVSEFISSKLPMIESNLEQSFLAARSELESLIASATTRHFLDPSQNALAVLNELSDLHKKLQSLISALHDLSRSRQTLKGKPFDLSFISPGEKGVISRQEVWKLFRRVSEQLEAWKRLPFAKFNAERALQKLASWQKSLVSLGGSLPAEDPVLQACGQLIEDFEQYLPVLEMLANSVLRQEHWKAIYTAMGEADPGDQQLTLSDLLALPLLRYSGAIAKIWSRAMAEMSCLQTLRKLQSTWQERQFRLAKFLLNVLRQDPSPDRSRRPSSGRIQEPEEGLFTRDTGAFILIDTEKLRLLLEDSFMTLQMLHFSPHAAALRQEVESWTGTLQDFGLFLDLWVTFQQKWIFLNKVLYEMDISFPRPELVSKFEMVDRGYREFIHTTCQDSLVLSIMAHQQSKRGWVTRGELLRVMFTDGITVMEEIIRDLHHLLETTRASCPRLYFLSDDEVIALLASSVEPAQRVPWVRRCFRNVQDVEFETLETDNSISVFAVYAPRAIAKTIIGSSGEKVPLRSTIQGDLQATAWLSHFEHGMKETLSLSLRDCLVERLSLKGKLDIAFGSRPGSTNSGMDPPKLHMAGEHWAELASSFPFQCILAAEEVSWWDEVEETVFVESAKRTGLRYKQRIKIEALVKYTQQRRSQYPTGDSVNIKLLSLLSALITLSVNHRDIICSLLKLRVESRASFEWAKLLKYRMNLSLPDAEECARKQEPGASSLQARLQKEVDENRQPGCYVEVLDGKLHYDYEYIGPKSMPVGTATMDKTMLGLILAVEQYHCGTVISQEGVTKTETILGLANALGRQIVVLNCSEQTGLQCISQQLCGAMLVGAWLLLDSADRLSQGTLSVLGQLLADVHKGCMAILQAGVPSQEFSSKAVPKEWSEEHQHNVLTGHDISRNPVVGPDDETSSSKPCIIGNIHFNGNIVSVRQNYGCFMTLSQLSPSSSIPANLRMVMRPVSMVYPDLKRVAEVSMLATGFQEATRLAGKIHSFFDLAQKLGLVHYPSSHLIVRSIIAATAALLDQHSKLCNANSCSPPPLGSKPLRSSAIAARNVETLTDAAEGVQLSTQGTEVHTLVSDRIRSTASFSVNLSLEEERALIRVLYASSIFSAPDSPDISDLKELLRNVFPMSVTLLDKADSSSKLGSALAFELQESKLHVNSQLTATMLQLYQALHRAQGVIIMGPPGSGKTTSWSILSRTLNRLASSDGPSTCVHKAEQDTEYSESYGPVTSECFYPNSMTTEEFLGQWEDGNWKDGLFTKLLRTSATISLTHLDTVKATSKERTGHRTYLCTPQKWVVLDGAPSSEWLDHISCLFGPHPFLSLPDSQQIGTPKSIRFIFEVTDLANISPSLSTQCSLVYSHGSETWRAVLGACMSSLYIRYSVTRGTADMMRKLGDELFPETLTFLENMCSSVLQPHAHLVVTGLGSVARGLHEITSFQKIFQAMLDLHLRRDKTQLSAMKEQTPGIDLNASSSAFASTDQRRRLDELVPAEHHLLAQHSFVYAYIWAFGGHLHPRHWPQFDVFVRGALLRSRCQIALPPAGSVFDLYLSPEVASLRIFDGSHLKGHILANITILSQYEPLLCLMNTLLGSCHPVLLTGEAGSGKSTFMRTLLHRSCTYHRVPITTCLSATRLRQLLASKVPRNKRGNIPLPPLHGAHAPSPRGLKSRWLFLLEDLHAAAPYAGNRSQPVLEVLRQTLSEHAIHSAESHQLGHHCDLQGINYIATVETAVGSAPPISTRFTRLFTLLSLPAVTKESLISIYAPMVITWLRHVPSLARPTELATAVVSATVDLYLSMKRTFKPSPSHSHYLFSLHDIEKVLRGLFLLSPRFMVLLSAPIKVSIHSEFLRKKPNPEYSLSTLNTRVLVRLWLHESLRTFCDRLLTEEEKTEFVEMLTSIAGSAFCTEDAMLKVSSEGYKLMDEVCLVQPQEEDRLEEKPPASATPVPEGNSITKPDVKYDHEGILKSETSEPEIQEQNQEPGREAEQHIVIAENVARLDSAMAMDVCDLTSPDTSERLSSVTPSSMEEDESAEETDVEETSSIAETLQSVVLKNRSRAVFSPSTSIDVPPGLVSSKPGVLGGIRIKESDPEGEVKDTDKKAVFQPSPPLLTKSRDARASARKHHMSRRKVKTMTVKKGQETPRMIKPTGPLLPPNLLLEPGEKLQDLIFSRHMLPTNYSEASVHSYQEHHPETLSEQLYTRLHEQSQHEVLGNGLVLCKEVLQHLARLIRILITPSGHSTLVATQLCTGRRSLVTLAAKLTQSKLFEVPHYGTDADVNTLVREASWNAGILGKSTVVLVDGRVGVSTLQKLLAVMAEGTFQGLYLPVDTEDIVQQFLEANKNIKKTMKSEVVLERFHQLVKNNLHVVMLLGGSGGRSTLSASMPTLLKLSNSVDVYHSWSYESLLEVASHQLEDASSHHPQLGQGPALMEYRSFLPCISRLLAQIHLSAASYAGHLSPHLPLITPKTFLDFIDVFLILTAQLQQTTGAQLDRMKKAVSRMEEVSEQVEKYRKEVDALTGRQKSATERAQLCCKQMEAENAALERVVHECHYHEAMHQRLMSQLEALQTETHKALDQISLEYSRIAGKLSIYDIEEIRTYRAPPPPVISVTDVLCKMFGREQGWENARQLIGQEDFYQELVFFKKDQMPDELYQALGKVISDCDFNPDLLQSVSTATASLCEWIRAIYAYNQRMRQLQPKLLQQEHCEDKANAEGVRLSKSMLLHEELQVTAALSTKNFQEALEEEGQLTRELSGLLKRKKEAELFQETVAVHASDWKAALKVLEGRCRTVPGDALLLAAFASYLGPFPSKRREELMEKWQRLCEGWDVSLHPDDLSRELGNCLAPPTSHSPPNSPIPLQGDFSIVELLSSVNERRDWYQTTLLENSTAQSLALLLRTCANFSRRHWPLLIDPDQQGEVWIRMMQKSGGLHLRSAEETSPDKVDSQTPAVEAPDAGCPSQAPTTLGQGENHAGFCVLPATDPDIDEKLLAAANRGAAVLVTHMERRCTSSVLPSLLCRETFSWTQSRRGPGSPTWPLQTGPTFRLYLSTSLPHGALGTELDSTFLKNLSVFDMSVSQSDLEEQLLDEILDAERPDMQSQQRGLIRSVQRVEDELRETEDSLLEKVIQAREPLLEEPDFLHKVHLCQEKMASLRSSLQGLVSLKLQQVEALEEYRKCARLGAALYSTLQEVSRLHPVYSFPLGAFLRLVKNLLLSKKRREALKCEVLKARVIDLMKSLTDCVLSYVQPCLAESHAKVFHFLVAAVQLRLVGQLTSLEWLVFLHGLRNSNMDERLPASFIVQPHWMTGDVWTECSLLELLPTFKNLRSSLVNQASQWQEYFNLSSTVIGPVPCASHAHLTLIQKAILWRVLRPDRLLNVISDFTTCMLGQASPEHCGNEMDSMFPRSRGNVPLVFLLPGSRSAGPSTHPLYWIEQMALEHSQEENMRVLPLGSADSKAELLQTFIQGKKEGHWIVLDNCHLSDHWHPEVTRHLMELLGTSDGDVLPKDSALPEDSDSRRTSVAAEECGSEVHPGFRLSLIIDGDAAGSLPALLKQHAMKVFCDTPLEMKSVLKRSFCQAVRQLTPRTPFQHVLALVVLHGVLLHRQHYRGMAEAAMYHWTQAELSAALSVQERIWNLCDNPEEAMVTLAGSVIYGGHVLDPGDEEAVLSVARQCLDISSSLLCGRGIHSLLSALTRRSLAGFQASQPWIREAQERIQQLPSPADPVTFGLCDGAAEAVTIRRSHEMLADVVLSQDVWKPGHPVDPVTFSLCDGVAEAVTIGRSCEMPADVMLSQGVWQPGRPAVWEMGSMETLLSECVKQLREMEIEVKGAGKEEEPRESQQRPLRRFLHGEHSCFTDMISQLLTDLCCFQDQLLGDPCLCRSCDDIAQSLARGTLPRKWVVYATARSEQPVLQWLQHLKRRLHLLLEYLGADLTQHILYNLSVFRYPKRLLVAVVQERAQTEKQDLDQYHIEAQVMQSSVRPRSALQHGIYLTGLELRNALWDTRLAVLQETLSSKPCSLPAVWIRAVRVSGRACSAGSVFPRYLCPLYMGTAGEEVIQMREQAVMLLSLITKMDPGVCSQRRVHAVSVL